MEAVGVGRRAVAIIIDSILLMILGYIIAMVTGSTTQEGFNLTGGPAFLLMFIGLAYYIVMEALWGATLGKKAMGLKVVKEGGEPIDWQASIVRNVLRLIDGFFFYLVAAIVVWVSKKKQRLGDMAAHTLVVKRMLIPFVAALAFAGFHHSESAAASPRYTDIVLSDSKGGPAKDTFKPNTAKVFMHAKVADIPAGTKLKSDWIAEKTKVAPANHKMDSSELTVTALGAKHVDFNFSKPNKGWPEGDYRVDLFIDGKPAQVVKFKVVK